MGKLTPKNTLMAVAAFAAFVILLKLGFWQLERLEWKRGILAQIAAEQTVDAQSTDLSAFVQNGPPLKRGYLEGQWAGETTIIGPKARDGQWGNWLVTPLKLADGTIVMINRGWSTQTVPPPAANAKVMGALRTTGEDHLPDYADAAPMMLFMESAQPADSTVAVPGAVNIRNEHKNYAIFWFTMAFALVVVAVLSLRGRN